MIIEKEIFKGIKNVGRKKVASIDVFPYAEKMYNILMENNSISELEKTPLLGNITVSKKDSYSRYDYTMMQLYMYQFVRKNLNADLTLSLGNKVKCREFNSMTIQMKDNDFEKIPSIADLLQILAFIYNIGHFKNTFTASRAALNIIRSNDAIKEGFLSNFTHEHHINIAKNIIETNNYHRFHLLNSLLFLLNINEDDNVVILSINLLTEYLMPKDSQSEKLKYIFNLFVTIRQTCFVAMDLSIAPVPIYLDFYNDRYLKILLTERLSGYNDRKQITNLFNGLNKLLQDTVYNEESNALIQFDITTRILKKVENSQELKHLMQTSYLSFINSTIDDELNIFNAKYSKRKDFDSDNILKLSFSMTNQTLVERTVEILKKMNFVKVAWYHRYAENKITLLISIKSNCDNKLSVSLRITTLLLNFIHKLRLNDDFDSFHVQTLLTIKFCLYYLFNGNKVILEGKVNPDICVLLERGRNNRIRSIESLLNGKIDTSNDDEVHEIEVLKQIMLDEKKNDLGITICSSIVIKNKNDYTTKIAEFDGLIIFPNRKEGQIIFVESKNTKDQPSYSKRCLIEKFKTFNLSYDEDEICLLDMDCMYRYTIN